MPLNRQTLAFLSEFGPILKNMYAQAGVALANGGYRGDPEAGRRRPRRDRKPIETPTTAAG